MSVFAILTGIFVLAALLTLVPRPSASKECLWGYRALCSFSPISTGILAVPALICAILWIVV
jgi:hypothetical protein